MCDVITGWQYLAASATKAYSCNYLMLNALPVYSESVIVLLN